MMTQTTFTVEQANRMLPLVRRIVEDLVADYRRWQDTVHAFESASISSHAPGAPDARLDGIQRRAQQLAADVEHYLGELSALGIECKSLEQGLIDFPGEVDGERVCLCWQLGEESVEWWHTPEAGFAGRRRLTSAEVV